MARTCAFQIRIAADLELAHLIVNPGQSSGALPELRSRRALRSESCGEWQHVGHDRFAVVSRRSVLTVAPAARHLMHCGAYLMRTRERHWTSCITTADKRNCPSSLTSDCSNRSYDEVNLSRSLPLCASTTRPTVRDPARRRPLPYLGPITHIRIMRNVFYPIFKVSLPAETAEEESTTGDAYGYDASFHPASRCRQA